MVHTEAGQAERSRVKPNDVSALQLRNWLHAARSNQKGDHILERTFFSLISVRVVNLQNQLIIAYVN